MWRTSASDKQTDTEQILTCSETSLSERERERESVCVCVEESIVV